MNKQIKVLLKGVIALGVVISLSGVGYCDKCEIYTCKVTDSGTKKDDQPINFERLNFQDLDKQDMVKEAEMRPTCGGAIIRTIVSKKTDKPNILISCLLRKKQKA